MLIVQEVATGAVGVKQRQGETQVEIKIMFHKVRVAPQGWDIVEPPEQGLLPQADQAPVSSSDQLTHGNLKLKVRSKSERVVTLLFPPAFKSEIL